MKNITEQDKNEYMQWRKDNGKMRYELTDIIVNDNGKIEKEKRMAWVSDIKPEDWYQFCKETGREYEGTINLLALY